MRQNVIAHPRSHKIIEQTSFRQTAYHEAGHAAAIYLGNQQKNLPPVYFEITLQQKPTQDSWQAKSDQLKGGNTVATMDGGRLIHSIPISLIESQRDGCLEEKQARERAYEADVFNLLAGPLAEAKHIALSDNETFNPCLVTLDALHYYGGTSDLKKVKEYLDSFIEDPQKQAKKRQDIFLQAFQFIEKPVIWKCITELAEYILEHPRNAINCKQAIQVINQAQASSI